MKNIKKLILKELTSVNRIPDSFLKWLSETDFFTAPASTKYHNVFEGGLAQHSYCVFNLLYEKSVKYKLPINYDSIVICGLLHDLCKVGRYYQENGIWKSKDELPLGHSAKSIFFIQKFFQLTEQEAMMIMYHMGPFQHSVSELNTALKAYPEIMALYLSDHETTALMER